MIMVLGYYGYANLGDEAILATLCDDLENLGIKRKDILVPSGNPAKTEQEHGVKALDRFSLTKIWAALGSTHCLIVGGGSLLQDVTSKRSIPYYLSLVELAFVRNVPVFMYGQGVGPISTVLYQRWVKRAFNRSTSYTVRDEESVLLLENFGVSNQHGILTADPVFQKSAKRFESAGSRFLFNLRPYALWPQQKEQWVEFLNHCFSQGFEVEFIPLGPEDRELGLVLQEEISELKVWPTLNRQIVDKAYAGATFCVSMRLHGLIFAALNGVLPLGLNYDPKVEAICKQLAVPWVDLTDLEILPSTLEVVNRERARYGETCTKALKCLEKRAQGNFLKLTQVVGGYSK